MLPKVPELPDYHVLSRLTHSLTFLGWSTGIRQGQTVLAGSCMGFNDSNPSRLYVQSSYMCGRAMDGGVWGRKWQCHGCVSQMWHAKSSGRWSDAPHGDL